MKIDLKNAIKWNNVQHCKPLNNTLVLCYIKERDTTIITHYINDDFALIKVGIPGGFSKHGVTHWVEITKP